VSYLSNVINPSSTMEQSYAIRTTAGEGLSYAELATLVTSVGKQLADAGIEPTDRVALVTPDGPAAATGFVALSAFTAVAPLNQGYRSKELAFYLGDLQPAAVVVNSRLDSPVRQEATALDIPIIELDEDLDTAGSFSLNGVQGRPQSKNDGTAASAETALILHTSGTTSRPKMVPLSRTNLSRSAVSVCQTLGLTQTDSCLNIMPLFHIHGLVAALLASLQAGGSVVCTDGLNARRLLDEWLPGLEPTWYTAVPTMHQNILAAARDASTALADSSLRFIRSSSASLPPTVLKDLEDVFRVPVIEAYGMTEASHQMSSNPLPPGARKPGSVGIAAGPEIRILSESDDTPLEQGDCGEIAICGASVTSGYLANTEANAAAFVGDWFRTGDQGYLDADGYLFITGRLKEIVNRGGEKVSPREIDEAALEIDGVEQAVAFGVPHRQLGEDLNLAVVCASEHLTSKYIRTQLFERLADFKVPSRVVLVDHIPKGPTGKVQRVNLADALSAQLQVAHVEPRNEFEKILVGVFEEILKIDTIGVDDNFFATGGDSLQGARVAARLSDLFEINLASAVVFQSPTPAELVDRVAEQLVAEDPENAAVVEALKTYSAEELNEQIADT